jgi:hypothetical protein
MGTRETAAYFLVGTSIRGRGRNSLLGAQFRGRGSSANWAIAVTQSDEARDA